MWQWTIKTIMFPNFIKFNDKYLNIYLCSSHKSFISLYQFLCLWRKPCKQQRKLSLAVLNKSKMVLEFTYQNKCFTLHFFNIVIFNQQDFMLTIEHTKTSHFHWWSIDNVHDVTGYYGVQDILLRPSFYRVLIVKNRTYGQWSTYMETTWHC